MRNKRIPFCLYAVPNPLKVKGGPRTRIREMARATKKNNSANWVIVGNSKTKLLQTLRAPRCQVCYVESATNRIKLIDLLCLTILKMKSQKTVVFIRDVYIILIPDNYKSLRKKITEVAHNLTNRYFIRFSNFLTFPTLEMGRLFRKHYKINKKYFELPPGSFDVSAFKKENIEHTTVRKLKTINFLYLGSTKYKNSGIATYYRLIKALHHSSNFHILTADKINETLSDREIADKVKVKSVDHAGVLDYFETQNITFLIHSRPANTYDDMTYPIKIMDCISAGIPVISLPHKPLVRLFGKDYPFFVSELTAEAITKLLLDKETLKKQYKNVLLKFYELKEQHSYGNKIKKIAQI